MGTTVSDIVTVSITRETKPISERGLGIILILGVNATFSDATRIQYYSDLTSLAADLTNGVDDIEYKMAEVIFSQNPRPIQIALGKKITADTSYTEALDGILVVSKDFYGVVIDSRLVEDQLDVASWVLANERIASFASDDTDIINLSDGIDTLQRAKLTFDADLITGNLVDITVNGNVMTQVPFNTDHSTTMGDVVTQLIALPDTTAVLDAEDATDHTIIVNYTAGNISIDSAVVTGGATQANIIVKLASLPVQLKAAANDRVHTFFTSNALTNFPDAGILGKVLPLTPGSYTGMFKTLNGVIVDILSTTQAKNAHDKFCNTYEEVGEVNIVIESWIGTGEFIDIIIFQDWLKNNITINVFSLLVNSLKVPYTDGGIASVESRVQQILQIGLTNGGISPFSYDKDTKVQTGGYVTSVPLASDIPANDKNNRILRNVEFTAWLAGAIHTAKIIGVLTV